MPGPSVKLGEIIYLNAVLISTENLAGTSVPWNAIVQDYCFGPVIILGYGDQVEFDLNRKLEFPNSIMGSYTVHGIDSAGRLMVRL